MVDFAKLTQDLRAKRHQESCWQQGATAARSGHPAIACPFQAKTYDFVTWHNGWAMARHEMAKAEPQQDYEEF